MKLQRGQQKEEMRKSLIKLSKENGFISPETTFILMELREEPVLGIQLKNIIPIKVDETTLGEKINENVESGFWYRSFNAEENENLSDNRYLDEKYTRGKLLRIIAKNQFADGAFVDYEDSNIEDKIETTSMVVLAFIMGDEKINIYNNQLNKAAAFICKSYAAANFAVRSDIVKLSIMALNKIKRKKLLKDKYISQIDHTIEKLCEILHSKEETKHILRDLMKNSFEKNLASLFTLSEDGKYIEEEITIVEERNSIFDMAKLAVLKALNR